MSEASLPVNFAEQSSVVQLPTRLSIVEAVAFRETCNQLLQKSTIPKEIIVDFSKTTFVDSSGIGALVSNHKITQQKGVSLILRNITPQVMAALSMTGLDKVLTLEPQDELINTQKSWSKEHLPTTHPSTSSWIKRFLDIVGSMVGLGITAILFVPIVITIKLDSPGPIFFGQTRCGWMGKQFKIWKFRSMCVEAEVLKDKIPNQASGAIFKNDNDPRVTRVGSFLRKTSLDELPQFWNVLKGEMSLVGTRPPTPKEVEIYQVPEWQRLNVKPGMTGEWQVNGRSQVRDFNDIIKLDLRYQENWSLIYDLKLIIKTILVVLSRKSGAV